jgi:feruloyl esterase
LHDLSDVVDTDLRPFASHGGKLIIYHGWSDTSIAPLITVVYYTAVQRDLGEKNVDRFLKLFMLPGMGYCAGGDGFSHFDTLTPLMAWVEQGKAPTMFVADKLKAGDGMGDGPDGREPRGTRRNVRKLKNRCRSIVMFALDYPFRCSAN